MKKAMVLGLALILIPLLTASCGIPQEKYDKLTSDLTAAQAQIQTLSGELTAKTNELAAKDTELKATKDQLEEAKGKIEVLNAIFIPAMTGELSQKTQDEMATIFLGWRDKVTAVGDPDLTAKFQAIIDSGGGNEVTMAFFTYLLEDIAKTLK